jgi:hypothetical protein
MSIRAVAINSGDATSLRDLKSLPRVKNGLRQSLVKRDVAR